MSGARAGAGAWPKAAPPLKPIAPVERAGAAANSVTLAPASRSDPPDPMVRSANRLDKDWAMRRDHYVFGYDAEPADERPTDYWQTNFGQTSSGQSSLAALSTVAAPWTASEHSTFDEPSRSIERIQALKERARRPYLVAALVLLSIVIIASAVTLAMRS